MTRPRADHSHEVAQRYISGESAVALAKEYGMSEANVRYHAKVWGYEGGHQRLRVPPAEAKAICETYESGWTIDEVAIQYHRDPDTVRKVLERADIPIRTQQDYYRTFTEAEELELCELYLTGATLNELAGAHDTEKSVVANVLERRGIPRRTMTESRQLRGTYQRVRTL